jgi:hypothetical protein
MKFHTGTYSDVIIYTSTKINDKIIIETQHDRSMIIIKATMNKE